MRFPVGNGQSTKPARIAHRVATMPARFERLTSRMPPGFAEGWVPAGEQPYRLLISGSLLHVTGLEPDLTTLTAYS